MWIFIFGILLIYVLTVPLLHYLLFRRNKKKTRTNQVLFITHNNQSIIEWYIRILLMKSKLKGDHIFLCLIDKGSTDETMQIIKKFAVRNETLMNYCKLDHNQCIPPSIIEKGNWKIIRITCFEEDTNRK